MIKFADYCMKSLEKALVDFEWVGDLFGWLALNILATLFCLVMWPFALIHWLTGGKDEK